MHAPRHGTCNHQRSPHSLPHTHRNHPHPPPLGIHTINPLQIHQLPIHHLYTLPNDANTFLPPDQHTGHPTPTPFDTRWMVDIYLVANTLALSALPSHTAMTALNNTLESIYDTHLPNPTITIPPPHLTDSY